MSTAKGTVIATSAATLKLLHRGGRLVHARAALRVLFLRRLEVRRFKLNLAHCASFSEPTRYTNLYCLDNDLFRVFVLASICVHLLPFVCQMLGSVCL